MQAWICNTCGTQFPQSEHPPETCPICAEERQYVGHGGQQWTTLERMRADGFRNSFYEHEPNLIGIGTVPKFAIGQRALLVRTPHGNVLWDCISYIDDITEGLVRGLGGIQAVAISHPHYYSAMKSWAERFDAPVYLHEADGRWVTNPHPHVHFWSGDTLSLVEGVRLCRLGGHFDGGTVLHWAEGADGKGVLLTGDIIQVVADRNWVSFMYSYPNLVPLPARTVASIRDRVANLVFDRIYGAWFDALVKTDAKNAVKQSAARYIRALAGSSGAE